MAWGEGIRPWMRGLLATISGTATPLGQGEILVDDEGGIYGGDGTTPIQDLKRAVRVDDPRLPSAGSPEDFRVSDLAGQTALRVDGAGVTHIGDTQIEHSEYKGLRVRDVDDRVAFDVQPDGTTRIGDTQVQRTEHEGVRILDKNSQIAFEVRPDGTTFIGELVGGSGGAGAQVTAVHVLVGAGQSNMSGRGIPTSPDLDPTDSRIFQYGSGASEITPATTPLDMVDTPSGLSPLSVIAREYLAKQPPGVVVLLIPAARGDTGLASATNSGNPNGVWNSAYTGTSPDLYGMLKTQTTQALAAATAKWPGATVAVKALFWHQGEANSATAPATYQGYLDDILAGYRTHIGNANLPIVLGGMVPEYVAASSGLQGIRGVHVDTPVRLTRAAYADGPPNGGGSASVTDLVHYHREGVEGLGAAMLAGYQRALLNTPAAIAQPPREVAATLIAGTLTVRWSQPKTRYTGFVVEYSDNGGAWTAIAGTTADTTATVTGLTGPVRVRVATVNTLGTSAATAPITALGA